MAVRTFYDLERAETISSEDLKDTLREYARSGAGISGRVVTELVRRTPLTQDDLNHLQESARLGEETQQNLRQARDAAQYADVSRFVQHRHPTVETEMAIGPWA